MQPVGEFETFAREVNQLVTAPYKEISASFIVSAIAGTVQFGDFSPAFLAFTTLCGGVAGTAAVLTVYLSASRNPASLFSTFQPSRVSRAVLVLFVGTLLCLGLFYALATAGTSWCLAPAIVGVFLLFRAVALAAVTLRLKTRFGELTQQQQDAIYQRELQSRQARLKERQDVERALADSSRRLSEATARTQAWMEEVRQQEEERQKEARREKLRYVLATPMRLTRGIRKRIGLLTTAERFDDAQTELAVDRLFYGEAAKAVVEGRAKLIRHEGSGLELYQAENLLFYLIEGAWDMQRAQKLLDTVATVGRQIVLLVRPGATLSVEAESVLIRSGRALRAEQLMGTESTSA